MTFVNTTPLTTNDTTVYLPQNTIKQPIQVRRGYTQRLASLGVSLLLAFGGGFGFAAAQDLVEDGQLTTFIGAVK